MKIIPVRQAGVLNFLGRQKMVTVPIRWKSGEGDKHPETELAYITKPEKEKLIKLDMHGSMKDGKPNFGPAGLISLNSGGDGGAGGDGGGDGGNGDGGSDGGGSSGDSGSTGDGGSDASDTGDTGSESGNDAASASAAAGGSGSSSGGGDATDTGDMGSEAANDAATASANASVGANSSFGGYNPSRGFDAVSTGTANATDTGDLGSEAANDAATASGAASVGQGTFSAYSQIGTKMTNISNYMKGNPGTTLGLNAISLLTGIPGLALAYAVNSIYGTPSTNTSTSTSSTNSGGGNTYNASQISQILTQVANQYTGPSAAKNFAQKYPSSSQSGTLSFQSAYDTAKQNLGSLLTAPMSPYGNNAVSASPFYDYLKKNNLDRGIL
jgi:hypothetical protein